MCDRWLNSFESFYADMGPKPSKKHSIDRFPNNDGDYEPGNCRWATAKEQGRNTRTTNFIEIDGKKLCVVDWCEFFGIPRKKPYEMTRHGRGANKLAPKHPTVESAIRELYRLHMLKP